MYRLLEGKVLLFNGCLKFFRARTCFPARCYQENKKGRRKKTLPDRGIFPMDSPSSKKQLDYASFCPLSLSVRAATTVTAAALVLLIIWS